MKYTVLFFFSIFAISTSFAQRFEFGINGGIGFNSERSASQSLYSPYTEYEASSVSPSVSLKAMYVEKNWQYGLSVGWSELAYKFSGNIIPNNTVNHFDPLAVNGYVGIIYPPVMEKGLTPYSPLKFFLNRKKTLAKMELYGGLSLGYVFIANSSGKYSPRSESFSFGKNAYNGYSIGMQVGCTHYISKHTGINAEINCDHLKISSGVFKYTDVAYTASLGLRYRL